MNWRRCVSIEINSPAVKTSHFWSLYRRTTGLYTEMTEELVLRHLNASPSAVCYHKLRWTKIPRFRVLRSGLRFLSSGGFLGPWSLSKSKTIQAVSSTTGQSGKSNLQSQGVHVTRLSSQLHLAYPYTVNLIVMWPQFRLGRHPPPENER